MAYTTNIPSMSCMECGEPATKKVFRHDDLIFGYSCQDCLSIVMNSAKQIEHDLKMYSEQDKPKSTESKECPWRHAKEQRRPGCLTHEEIESLPDKDGE